jgi:NAD(P)-dependent dehydrogenase (short-subunit alcohol dehydrogenase family)
MAKDRRVALVTGASRGIGRCGALALAERGYDVIISARTVHEGDGREKDMVIPGSLDKTEAEIGALGRDALPIAMDVMDRGSILAGWERAMAAWGRVDVLVNNAPYSGPGTDAKLLEIDCATATRVVEADYVNQVYLTQLVLPGMLERGRGTVVNLGSGSALVPPPGPAGEGGWSLVHCAAKAAFHQLAVILDVEFRSKGIRAFTLEPGYTVTEKRLALNTADEFASHFRGDPPEVAGAVIGWLADEGQAEADQFLGDIVHAQAICKRHGLVAGWPPRRSATRG